jgi:hypothetical protein
MIENSTDNILFDDEYKKFEKRLKIWYLKFVKNTANVCDPNTKISITLTASPTGKYVGKEVKLNDNN